jgi:hypothetical protein
MESVNRTSEQTMNTELYYGDNLFDALRDPSKKLVRIFWVRDSRTASAKMLNLLRTIDPDYREEACNLCSMLGGEFEINPVQPSPVEPLEVTPSISSLQSFQREPRWSELFRIVACWIGSILRFGKK